MNIWNANNMEKDKKEFIIILLGGMTAIITSVVVNHIILDL